MPEDWEPAPPVVGSASPASGDELADAEYPLAMLWLPNPEYASGWETRRVRRQKPAPERKPWRGLVR